MDVGESVSWARDLLLLSDTRPAGWVTSALTAASSPGVVAAMVPSTFSAYARILPPTYGPDDDDDHRYRWSEIAASRGVALTAETWFDDLVGGSEQWGRPADGGLDVWETAVLAGVLANFTGTPTEAFFCVWEGLGLRETNSLAKRPARVRAPHRAYHLFTGPVDAVSQLPKSDQWMCASLWWPADRNWLVATDIDGYLTYVGGSRAAVEALIAHPDLDAVVVEASTPLDPSYG